MKRRLLVGLVTGLFLIGIAGTAGATLISKDLSSPGDGQLTYDSDTGLSWLNVSNTATHNYNEILSGFGGYITDGALGTLQATR